MVVLYWDVESARTVCILVADCQRPQSRACLRPETVTVSFEEFSPTHEFFDYTPSRRLSRPAFIAMMKSTNLGDLYDSFQLIRGAPATCLPCAASPFRFRRSLRSAPRLQEDSTLRGRQSTVWCTPSGRRW